MVPVIVSRLLVASQPNPDDSDVIDVAVSKKAICPAVPVPEIPPAPVVQVITLLLPSIQRADPDPEASPNILK